MRCEIDPRSLSGLARQPCCRTGATVAFYLQKVAFRIPSRRTFCNTSRKDPDRHRRAYEAAGQLWPTDLAKHLARAQALEAADRKLREVA